jgi:hypothetical protein
MKTSGYKEHGKPLSYARDFKEVSSESHNIMESMSRDSSVV